MVYSRKQKLRAELANLPNEEIRDRRLAGEVRISRQRFGVVFIGIASDYCIQHIVVTLEA